MYEKLVTLGHRIGFILGVSLVLLFAVIALPQLVGADSSYVVLSDSMEPALSSGDVIIVDSVSADTIQEGDIITYTQSKGLHDRVTHRVTDVVEQDGERKFKTKGDANEEADAQLVSGQQVIGRVMFSIPYIGYAVALADTDVGLVGLVILPAVLLMLSEAWLLVRAHRASASSERSGAGTQRSSEGD